MEHGGQHQLLVGAQTSPSKPYGDGIIRGVFEVLEGVLPVRGVLPDHIHAIDGQERMSHCAAKPPLQFQTAQ